MAREKGKGIANFDKYDDDSNINTENIAKSELFSSIGRKEKSTTHTYKGFYIENDLVEVIDRIADPKLKGKGAKSDLINKVLRDRFLKEGLIKKRK